MPKTILIEETDRTALITLNRPQKRNAINNTMIDELSDAFLSIADENKIRMITITGSGNVFCSGADLEWLRKTKDSNNDNYDDSRRLAELLKQIHEHPKPVICRVNGSAVGGGVGIMLASDIIIADEKAVFGLSEASIGIIPAAIIPFLISRIGETKAREFLITGSRINSQTALDAGLINYSTPSKKIDTLCSNFEQRIINNGPRALTKIKAMINKYTASTLTEQDIDYIAETIARLRQSDEALEGISAFLEKRKPNWHSSKQK